MQFRTPAGDAFDVPDELLWSFMPPLRRPPCAAYVHAPGGPLEIRLAPIVLVEPPRRLGDIEHFNPGRTMRILTGMAAGDPLPPVRVVEVTGEAYQYRVRDGFHRYHLSLVCGYASLPLAIDPWNEPWMWPAPEQNGNPA